MAHLQYMPGDPRLVDQLVYELKSKGIFDQFRKDCIADVDTRPAYQNLRQRVESSVSTFLSRQCWKPDLNKNQLREKLRKHILDGNYLEQGVERIVDQVVNPKVASVFIPQVEDLVYNYLGITRKKAPETSDVSNLLPTDLEAVSPGSVKSIDKDDQMDTEDIDVEKMEIDEEEKPELKEECKVENNEKEEQVETNVAAEQQDGNEEKNDIPHSAESIKLEDIPAPDNSPPNLEGHLKSVPLPKDVALTDIPLPEDGANKSLYFKPLPLPSEDSNSSSDSSLRRNMSPLTPIRNYTNENSCDAQQAFDNDSDGKNEEKKEPSSFRFAIESSEVKVEKTPETKTEKKEDPELAYQFNRVNINSFNTPLYDDSSNSNNLRIDYESDTNSKMIEAKQEIECSEEAKKEKKVDDKKNHKSSHRSRDSHRHSNSKDKRSESKQSSSRDSSRHDKKSSSTRDDHKKSSKESRDRSKDRSDRKDSRDSSKHRSSSSSHRSSSHRDSKSHRSSSSSHKHSSSRSSDVKKSSSSSNRDKERSSDNKDKSSRDKDRKDSRSSSHRSDKDRKSSSSSKKSDEKDKKKDKKETDDHYSSSGRGNNGRRSTDRDSNDGSSSSKGSHNQNGAKTSDSKKESKNSSSKSDNTSPSGDSTSPSDKDQKPQDNSKPTQFKPVRVENLETPIANPPRLPFVPDVTLKKPKFAANFEEAKKMMKMRKFLDDEQKRMNQEAALLLEFQANVRPSLSQVYSSIPGPELEFVCGSNTLIANPACEITNTDPDADNFAVPQVITERPRTESLKRKRSISESVPNSDEKNKNVEETDEYIEKNMMETDDADDNNKITYDENKPFSLLVEEISEYSKASENKVKDKADIGSPNQDDSGEVCEIDDTISDTKDTEIIDECANVTISSTEEEILGVPDDKSEVIEQEIPNIQTIETTAESDNVTRNFEITESIDETELEKEIIEPPKYELKYFSNEEISTAETQINEFDKFFKNYMEQITNNKLYLINCDSYEENIMKEVATSFGDYEIVNYLKNGHLRLPNTSKNIVKDVPLCEEVSLPIENIDYAKSPVFSPTKSECSFDLSSDYDAKLSEIVNKKSRQEVLEIILGSVIDMDSETSVIDYDESSDSNKRKFEDEGVVNNNRSVLTPTKIRKLSDSDQISSTTEDKDEVSNNNKQQNVTRSKYLGKAKRVGLPRPKRCNLVNSPSSDKSVENYVQNTQSPSPQPPNGKLKNAPRTKVQRYDTSDLYKPKLHYLSRRNVS